MTHSSRWRALLVLAALGAAAPARAKVYFTGYGDLRYTAQGRTKLTGTPSVLGAFGAAASESEQRGFRADAIGLFATTEIKEDLSFLLDVTYREIGSTVGQLRLQYAYLDYAFLKDADLKVGKVTLPFGYFNENRFYGFQRIGINPPLFLSGILGLPIADWGLVAQKRFPGEVATPEVSVFVINGYGPVSGTRTHLREPSALGLAMSNALRAADSNHKPAYGGRVRLTRLGGKDAEAGASYYRGEWDTSGLQPLQMINAHAHARLLDFDLLVEGLRIDAEGDEGFKSALGESDWRTQGGFGILSYRGLKVRGMPLSPFAQTEYYRSRAKNGAGSRETVRRHSGGFSLQTHQNVALKAEYSMLTYALPVASLGGEVVIDQEAYALALVVTF